MERKEPRSTFIENLWPTSTWYAFDVHVKLARDLSSCQWCSAPFCFSDLWEVICLCSPAAELGCLQIFVVSSSNSFSQYETIKHCSSYKVLFQSCLSCRVYKTLNGNNQNSHVLSWKMYLQSQTSMPQHIKGRCVYPSWPILKWQPLRATSFIQAVIISQICFVYLRLVASAWLSGFCDLLYMYFSEKQS